MWYWKHELRFLESKIESYGIAPIIIKCVTCPKLMNLAVFCVFCNPIIPNFAHGSTVLWETAKKKGDFHWTAIHQKYFQSLPKQFTILKTGNLCIKDNSNNRTTLRPTRFTCDVPKLYFSKIQKIPNRLLKDRYTCNKDKLIVSFFIRKSKTSITAKRIKTWPQNIRFTKFFLNDIKVKFTKFRYTKANLLALRQNTRRSETPSAWGERFKELFYTLNPIPIVFLYHQLLIKYRQSLQTIIK